MMISRRNFLAVAGVAAATAALTACGGSSSSTTTSTAASTASSAAASSEAASTEAKVLTKVAVVCDSGTIDDESFNQACYTAAVNYIGKDNVEYYLPPEDPTDEDRETLIRRAVNDGAQAVICVGYLYGASLAWASEQYPDTCFIAVDVTAFDIGTETIPANVHCITFKEEQAGYLAGYAVVKDGYNKLGFLGGMAVPAVIRFGYGFVQGVDAAAKELGITVDMKYAYGNQFYGDADITAVMDTWYAAGTEIVFACGGGIYNSAAEAAKKVGGKVIGVDTDQAPIIDGTYGEGMTVTSAMKGLYPTTIDTLTDVVINGKWADYAGKISTLGLVSGDDASLNYVQLGATQFADGKFTEADYAALVKGMFDGSVTVSNDTSAEPAVTNVNVEYLGNLK